MKEDGMSGSVTGILCREYPSCSDVYNSISEMRHRVHSATTGGEGEGRGHNGGVWEWTSTVFDGYEGFEPSTLYPGFSADFYDTLHNVVVSDLLSHFFS
jgi:hypothetical protein